MIRICRFRVLQCYIDLTRNALVALCHCSRSLADVDFIDPIPRNKEQAANSTQAPWPRQVVHLNLAVFTIQTQHANLTRTRHSIGEGCIHRRIGLKRFGKVATGRFGQLLSVQGLHIQWRQQRELRRRLPFHHLCCSQINSCYQWNVHIRRPVINPASSLIAQHTHEQGVAQICHW